MLEGHIRIRRDADILARQPSLSLVHQLGTQLAEHVQLEEQQVFPLIEQTIPAHELATLSSASTPRGHADPARPSERFTCGAAGVSGWPRPWHSGTGGPFRAGRRTGRRVPI